MLGESVQYMLEQLGAVSSWLPPLVRVIIYILFFTLAWIIAAFPAHWLSKGGATKMLGKASAWFLAAFDYLYALASRLFASCASPVDAFVATHAYEFTLIHENDRVVRSIAVVRTALNRIPASFTALDRTMAQAQAGAERRFKEFARIPRPNPLQPPGNEEFALIQVATNHAVFKTIFFFIASLALISINTAMLEEFWASIVPNTRILGDVRLPLVFSFMFSILEVVFGAAIPFFEGRSLAANAGRAGIIVLITALALIEFGFYSQFSQQLQSTPFDAFYENAAMPGFLHSWLGIFGPVIVFGLAVSGDMVCTGIRDLNKKYVIRQWRSHLRQRTRAADKIQRKLVVIERSTEVVNRALEKVAAAFPPVARASSSAAIERIMDAAREEFVAAIDKAQAIRLAPTCEIRPDAMLRIYYANLLMALSVIVAMCLIALAYGPFGIGVVAESGVQTFAGAALIGIVETCILLGLGHLSGRVRLQASGTGGAFVVGIWSRWFAYFVAVLVMAGAIAGNAAYVLQLQPMFGRMWICLLAVCVIWLFFCGRNLGLMLAAFWAFIECVAYAVASAGLYVFDLLFVGAPKLLLDFLCFLIEVLELPYRMLFLRDAPVAPQA